MNVKDLLKNLSGSAQRPSCEYERTKLIQKVLLPAKEKCDKINFLLIGVQSFLNCFSDFLNLENNEFIFSSLEDLQSTGIVGTWNGIKLA